MEADLCGLLEWETNSMKPLWAISLLVAGAFVLLAVLALAVIR